MAKQKGTSTPRSRGAYGSTRGKERQLRKRNNREQQYRNQRAAEETAAHQRELDALIARQQDEPAWGVAEGARIQKELEAKHAERMAEIENEVTPEDFIEDTIEEATIILKKKFSIANLRKDDLPNLDPFAMSTARMMLKAGYQIEHVMEETGVGYDELSDLPIDPDGYGCWKFLVIPDTDDEEEDDVADSA